MTKLPIRQLSATLPALNQRIGLEIEKRRRYSLKPRRLL
jgi:hypothetical protein